MAYNRSFHLAPHSIVQAAIAHQLKQSAGAGGIASDQPRMAEASAMIGTVPRRRPGDPRTRVAVNPSDATSMTAASCITLLVDYAGALLDGDALEAGEILNEYLKSSCDAVDWIRAAWDYVRAVLSGAHLTYVGPSSPSDGSFVHPLPEKPSFRIGILGDWGTGEAVAKQVLKALMSTPGLDLIVHVGDVYYAGTPDEVRANYLTMIADVRSEAGCNVPVYNLPGNHDYYTAGRPFYDALPLVNQGAAFLNPPLAPPVGVSAQTASFFSLQNSWLQLQGMDTGYYDSDMVDVGDDTTMLHAEEAKWHLNRLADANDGGRAVFLFSHHQPWSAFEGIGDGTGIPFNGDGSSHMAKNCYNVNLQSQFLGAPTGTVLAWFWGHEHVLQVYDQAAIARSTASPASGSERLSALFPWVPYGACIGFSAFPMLDTNNPYNVNAHNIAYNPNYVLGTTTNDATVYNHGYTVLDVAKNGNGPPSAAATYYQLPADGSSSTPSVVGGAPSIIC